MQNNTVRRNQVGKVGVSSKIMKFKFMQNLNDKEDTNTLAKQIEMAKEAQKMKDLGSDEDDDVTTGKKGPKDDDQWTLSSGLNDLIADNVSNKKILFFKKIKFNKAASVNAKAEGLKEKYDKPKVENV